MVRLLIAAILSSLLAFGLWAGYRGILDGVGFRELVLELPFELVFFAAPILGPLSGVLAIVPVAIAPVLMARVTRFGASRYVVAVVTVVIAAVYVALAAGLVLAIYAGNWHEITFNVWLAAFGLTLAAVPAWSWTIRRHISIRAAMR